MNQYMKWKFITISQTGSGSKRDCEEGFGSDYVTAQISLRMITELLAMDLMTCIHSVAAIAL